MSGELKEGTSAVVANNYDHLPYEVKVTLVDDCGNVHHEHYPYLKMHEIGELWGSYSMLVTDFQMKSLLGNPT